MSSLNSKLDEVVQKDKRYAYEAYEFVFQALNYTQEELGREAPAEGEKPEGRHHVTGPELLDGIRRLALREFGFMARTVLHRWGVNRTDDFGQIVFNLVAADLMSKTDDDNPDDFRGVYDLDEALVRGFRIQLDEAR